MINTEKTERVPGVFASRLYDYLQSRGEQPQVVLGQLYRAVDNSDPRGIRVKLWSDMLTLAVSHFNEPDLGLNVAETIKPHHLGTLGYLATACPTLAEVIKRLDRYQRLVYDVVSMSTRSAPDHVDLVWDTTIFDPGRLVNETGLAIVIQLGRALIGRREVATLITIPGPPPENIEPYLEWFGCEVQFGASEALIRVSREAMQIPLMAADANVVAVMERHAIQLLDNTPTIEPVIAQVRQAIARMLHDGEPDLTAVAVKLHSSTRSLQRLLNSADSSFRAELAMVRQCLAESYLRDRGLSIADIAMLLGYSEHSAFSRVYKGWTGISPADRRASIISN